MAYRKVETFNSMKYFELLKNSGVPEAQAKAQIEMVQAASQNGLEHLATQEALIETKAELKEDIANLKSTINTSKWQTISSIVALIIAAFFAKHLGF